MLKLSPLIDKIESERGPYAKKCRTGLILFFIFLAIGIGCLIPFFINNDWVVLLIIAIISIALSIIFIAVIYSKTNNKFRARFHEIFDDKIMETLYSEGYVSNSAKGLSLNELQESGIYKDPDKFSSSGYFAATIGQGVSFVSSDYDFVKIRIYTDSKGHVHEEEDHYRGKAFIFTFPRKFNHVLSVYEKGYNSTVFSYQSRKKKSDLESVEFNKKFKTYSDDPTFMFYIMTPQVQLNLIDFDNKISSDLVFTIKGNRLFMFLQNYSPKYNVTALKPVNEELVKSYVEELTTPLKIFDYLDIDKDKFLDKTLG